MKHTQMIDMNHTHKTKKETKEQMEPIKLQKTNKKSHKYS